MVNPFDISVQDWLLSPGSLQQPFSSLHLQLLLLEILSHSYQRQLTDLLKQVSNIGALKAELDDLPQRLGQNSNNSSKPASTDSPHQHHTPSNESSGRKRGRQVGHRGQAHKLKAVADLDRLIHLKPASCAKCGQD